MNRRAMLGLSLAAAGGIFAPKLGGWFRRGSGLVVPEGYPNEPSGLYSGWITSFDRHGFTIEMNGSRNRYHYKTGMFVPPVTSPSLTVIRA